MAHGFLGATTSDNSQGGLLDWLNKKLGITDKLKDELSKLLRNNGKKSGLVSVDKGPAFAYEKNNTNGVNVRDVTDKPAARMLKGTAAGLLKEGSGSITKSQTPALPPGGPRLSGGQTPGTPGGSFVNMPGVSAAPTPLNADTFFKRAVTGTGAGGEYLSTDDRKSLFAQSKSMRASDGDSGVDIVSAVNQVTSAIVNLQSTEQKSSTDNVRALSRLNSAIEEQQLEQGGHLSGFLTSENAKKKEKQEENKSITKLTEQQPGSPSSGGSGGIVRDIIEILKKKPEKTAYKGGKLGTKLLAAAAGGSAGKASTELAIGAAKPAAKSVSGAMAKTVGKNVAEQGAKTGLKSALKKIPGVGLIAGGIFGLQRALAGDFVGATGELASGVAGTIPGVGTAASLGIDAALMAKDMAEMPAMADGGIVTKPTTALIGDNPQNPFSKTGQAEGVFPLEGKEGKATFENFGEGLLKARKDNPRESAEMDADGLSQFFDKESGFDRLVKKMKDAGIGSGSPAPEPDPNAGDGDGGGDGTGSGQDMMTLATIAALESGSSQGQADVAQSVYNRVADGYGKSVSDVLTQDGQYQVAFKDPNSSRGSGTKVADEFKNIKTEDDAVKAILYYYNKKGQTITEAEARKKVRGSVSAIQNVDLQRKAAAHVGGRTEFLGRGLGGAGSVSRGSGSDNDFFVAYGSNKQMARGAVPVPTEIFAQANSGGAGGGAGGGADLSNVPPSQAIYPMPGSSSVTRGVASHHAGHDIVETPEGGKYRANPRTPILAMHDGKVLGGAHYNNKKDDYLAGAIINHPSVNADARYLHMNPIVKPGQTVKKGQVIGSLVPIPRGNDPVGNTHLHLELYKQGTDQNLGNEGKKRILGGSKKVAMNQITAAGASVAAAPKPTPSSPRIAAAPGSPAPGPAIAAASSEVALGSAPGGSGGVQNNFYQTGGSKGGSSPTPNSLPTAAGADQIGAGWWTTVSLARV